MLSRRMRSPHQFKIIRSNHKQDYHFKDIISLKARRVKIAVQQGRSQQCLRGGADFEKGD